MLHRSFKPAKCKTALKLAIPRIKLMKNKRENQVKQLKRELAQLLESGQDQTARIRVEHVVREEKTVAAYNLLEIYCELMVARMPIIESQKNCPIDLKEAIASVIFASARCAEIPELKDVSKHFTAKYGKEFISAALEVRPNCGVSRMLVEKLSANAPDGPTKLKILTAIAEEHNIKWDPESFGAKEGKIYEDLLNGPNNFKEATKNLADSHKQASNFHEERPPIVQVPNHDKGPPEVPPPYDTGKNDAHASNYEHKSRTPPYPKNLDSSNTSANNSMSSGTYPSSSKPYGAENCGIEFRNSYSGNESAFSSPRSNWNMEFRDATAAAQAAAESAERASMAARAAAELSSRENISQQYSTEAHMSSAMRDEEPWKYTGSASQIEHLARHPVDTTFHGRIPRNYEQTGSNEQQNQGGNAENVYGDIVRGRDKSTHGSSMESAATFIEKPSVNNQTTNAYFQRYASEGKRMEHFAEVSIKRNSGENEMAPSVNNQTTNAYFQRNSSEGKQMEHFAKVSIWRNSVENEMPFVNELNDSRNPQNVDHHEIRGQEHPNYSSSGSQLNSSDDDQDPVSNLSWQKTENDKTKSGETGMEFVNELHDIKNSENLYFHEVGISKQSSYSSSHFHSSTSTDHDVVSNLNRQKSGNNSIEDSFFLNDEGRLQRRTKVTADSYDNASAVFDDYGTDNDEYTIGLGKEQKGHEYSMNFSSLGQRSPAHPFTSTSTWSSEQNTTSPRRSISQSHIFSEQPSTPVFFESSTSSAVPSNGEDLPATFDNYGSSSESEEEVDKSKFVKSSDPSIHSVNKNLDSQQAESIIYTPQLAEGVEDTKPIQNPGLEESKELKYGNLTGGLRNKGYRHPPYMKIQKADALQSGDADKYTSTRIEQSSAPTAVEASVASGSYNQVLKSTKGTTEVNRKLSTRVPVSCEDSSDDDSDEEHLKQPFSSTQDQKNKMPSFEMNKRSSLKAPVPYFGSGESDSDDNLPKASPSARLNSGVSRRTKPSPSGSQRSSNLKTTSYDPTVVTSYNGEKNYPVRSSNANESPKIQPQRKISDHWDEAQPRIPPQKKNSGYWDEAQLKTQPQPQPQIKNLNHWDEARSKTQPQRKNTDHWDEAQSNYQLQRKNSDNWDENQARIQPHKKNSDNWNEVQQKVLPKIKNSDHWDEARTKTQPQRKNSDHTNEAQPITQPQRKNSDNWESHLKSRLATQTSSNLVSDAKKSSLDRTSKSSEKKQQPSTGIAKNLKSQNGGSSKESASHVHPKLPDYDTLKAQLSYLKQNRQ